MYCETTNEHIQKHKHMNHYVFVPTHAHEVKFLYSNTLIMHVWRLCLYLIVLLHNFVAIIPI